MSRTHKTTYSPPEVSVVVTCYNYAHYLEGCIQSILAQTYQDFEIILIDDGSTDETPDIAKKFQTVPNFFYVRQQNSGQARATNHGIELAKGTYVAFLDADDAWLPKKLEKQIALFDQPRVGVVYSKLKEMDPEGNILVEVGPVGRHWQPQAGSVVDWLLFENFTPFSSSMVRKQCLQDLGGLDENLSMVTDWDLWLRLSMHWEFAYVDEPLILYRRGHSQMSANSATMRACADLVLHRFLHDNASLLNPTAVRKARAYAYHNRGLFYLTSARWRSLRFFLLSLVLNPFSRDPYRGFYSWAFRR